MAIQYTHWLHRIIVRRANHLKEKLRSKKGGAPWQKFLQQRWELKLQEDEIKVSAMRAKIQELEQKLDKSREEASDLSEQVSALACQKEALEARTKKLESKVCSLSEKSPATGRGSSSSKDFSDYSKSHQRRLKRVRTRKCEDSLLWLHQEGLTQLAVHVKNRSTGRTEKITLDRAEMEDIFGPDELTEENIDILNVILLIKDQYNISSSAYHELTQICKALPRSYRVKERIKELNSRWNIRPTPHGTVGFQQSLEDCLRIQVQQLLKDSHSDSKFVHDRTLRLKLSEDGTKIGKRLHLVNFTFTLLDDGKKAYPFEGNHILAVVKEPEQYESMEKALADIIDEVGTLTTIEVNGTEFSIKFFVGGDWKFLAMATGIDSASSTYACIWCKCPSYERFDPEKVWSISDPGNGARTIEDTIQQAQRPKTRRQFNVSHPPLFPTIPLTNVVIDNLHLFLRVSDLLLDLLIIELRR